MKSMANHKVPFSGLPFQPALEHKITEPEPFSFDSRDKERWAMKEQKIQQIYEEEKKVSLQPTPPPLALFPLSLGA